MKNILATFLLLAAGCDAAGRLVGWGLVGARPVAPRLRAGRTTYAGVYPGVTLVLETRPGGIAYRWDVAPGADAGAIRMRYPGADRVAVEDRSLRVRAGRAWLLERGLRCFQDGGDVPCRYALADGAVTIALGPYDRGRALVIDPEIGWSSFLGAADNRDEGRGVALDALGNIYVAGKTFSSGFPVVGGFDTMRDGNSDAFVAKVDAGGTMLLWSSYLGGSGEEDDVGGAAVDGAGDVYLTGSTRSTDFPTAGGFATAFGGVEDAFVAKVTSSGALAWSTYLGGADTDEGHGIAADSGGVVVTGHTLSPDFPAAGGFDLILDGLDDAYVTRIDAFGGFDWSSFLGGSSDDSGSAVAVDAADNVYVTGDTLSLDFPSAGGFDSALGASNVPDAFVTKVNAGGSGLAWSTYLGGTESDIGTGLALDSADNVYVTGHTTSDNFPTPGGFDSVLDGGQEAFVAKVEASGSMLAWSSYLGGGAADAGFAVVVDAGGAVYVTGETQSVDLATADAFDATFGGAFDAFVARVDATPSLTWASYLGGSATDRGHAVALDAVGDVLAAGETSSADFPASGGFDTTWAGFADAFLVRIAVCGNDVCDAAEDPCSCEEDCGGDSCGNGCCGAAENECECAADCAPLCGDGCCGATEDACLCAADCGADSCGNGCCGAAENECACAEDCAPLCGDGCCGETEDTCLCAADCGEDSCGNGCCGPAEDACRCAADCGEDECANGCCGPLETARSCPDDCPDACGDGFCRGEEDQQSCAADCGPPEAPPEDEENLHACSCRLGAQLRGPSWLLLLLAPLLRARSRGRRARAASYSL